MRGNSVRLGFTHPFPELFLLMIITTSLLLLATPIAAQTVGGAFQEDFYFHGSSGQQLGFSVAIAGDTNGDGHDDLLVGARSSDPGGLTDAGSVMLYSGRFGTLLHQWDGTATSELLGSSVAGVGDLNGDGFADVMMGAAGASPGGLAGAGSVYVYSGLDGSLIMQLDGAVAGDGFGHSCAAVGDINADTTGDLIIGAPFTAPGGNSWAGTASVYSGADGSLLHEWHGSAALDSLGWSVAGAGDLNNDGTADLITGAPLASPGGVARAGSVFAYSGTTGALLHQWDGAASDDRLGRGVDGAGDLDADGFDDVVIGASAASPGGLSNAGSAFVYSGNTGALLLQWDGDDAGGSLGEAVAGAGDVNLDGTPDVLVGAPFADANGKTGNGSVFTYSGVDGSLLHREDGAGDFFQFGGALDGGGNVSPNGYADHIVGIRGQGSGGGAAGVYGFHPFLAASADTLSASGVNLIALEFDFGQHLGYSDYRLLVSASDASTFHFGVEIPLLLDGRVLRSYYGDYFALLHSGLQGTLSSDGKAVGTIGVMPNTLTPFVGRTFYMAAIVDSAFGLPGASSIALPITITP